MKTRNIDLEETQEFAIEFVCSQAGKFIDDFSGEFDDCDLFYLRDELDRFIKLNEKIEDCKSEKAIKNLLLKHYTNKEVREAIGY